MKVTVISTRDSVVDSDKLLDEALQDTFPSGDPAACVATASIAPAVRPATVGQVGHVATAPAKLARRPSGSRRTGTQAGAGHTHTASQGGGS